MPWGLGEGGGDTHGVREYATRMQGLMAVLVDAGGWIITVDGVCLSFSMCCASRLIAHCLRTSAVRTPRSLCTEALG